MPFKRVGKSVYVKRGHKWVRKGSSKNVPMAKKYLKVLYMHAMDL